MTTAPVYITDIIGEIVEATSDAVVQKNPTKSLLEVIQANEAAALGRTMIQQIRYSKSSFDELIATLAQADGSSEEKFNKYPLIHLVQDVVEERGQDVNVYSSSLLNIIFIHQTDQNYKIDDRDEKVFKPVLWPMYYQFMEELKKSEWVFGDYDTTGEFRHRVIKRAFWGNRNLQGSKNILNDYVDAIEIQNLQLKINFSNC